MNEKENSRSDADQYRLQQIRKILAVFKEMHGREAISIEEVEAWLKSSAGKSALAEHTGASGKVDPY